MTKKNMIEAIQKQEAQLFLSLSAYDNVNAYISTGTLEEEMHWEATDPGHREKLEAWAAIYDLMDELEIEQDFDLPAHIEASDLTRDLFLRRQAAQGIYY